VRALCLISFSVSAASAQVQSAERATVSEHFGNIEFADGQGFARTLTTDHKSGHPVLSPDGRTVAWIHIDKTAEVDQRGETSLWVADGLTGAIRKLSRGTQRDDFRSNIVNPYNAAFSLDGGFLYVTSELGSVTNGIHQIRLATSQHRFVIEGTLESLIRTGPYRGYLIVWQHRYFERIRHERPTASTQRFGRLGAAARPLRDGTVRHRHDAYAEQVLRLVRGRRRDEPDRLTEGVDLFDGRRQSAPAFLHDR
jgi:dipeptidyl aminopeptidase/acylaminoacyl peptidase